MSWFVGFESGGEWFIDDVGNLGQEEGLGLGCSFAALVFGFGLRCVGKTRMKVEMGSWSSWWALSRLNCFRRRRCARWGQAFDDGCDGGVQMRHSKSSLVIHHMTIPSFHQVRRSTSSIHAGAEECKDILIYLRPYTAGLTSWSRWRSGVFELLHLFYGFHKHALRAFCSKYITAISPTNMKSEHYPHQGKKHLTLLRRLEKAQHQTVSCDHCQLTE
jgi:hypothetical protein